MNDEIEKFFSKVTFAFISDIYIQALREHLIRNPNDKEQMIVALKLFLQELKNSK